MSLHFFGGGEGGARGTRSKTPPKNGIHALAGQTSQRGIKVVKRQTPQGVRAFCGGGIVGYIGRLHMALKAFQGTSIRNVRIIEWCELSMPKLVFDSR